jgi:hypothetical protein
MAESVPAVEANHVPDRTLVEVPGSLPGVYREVRARVCGYLHNRYTVPYSSRPGLANLSLAHSGTESSAT